MVWLIAVGIIGSISAFAQPQWVVSGAPIGDTSTYLYPTGGWSTTDQLTLALNINGSLQDSLRVFNVTGNPEGVHIYGVTKQPNAICDIAGLGSNDRYFGVFIASVSSGPFTYDAQYFYGGNPYVNPNNETALVLYQRPTNADTACIAWLAIAGNNDTVTTKSITVGTFGGATTLWQEDFGFNTGSTCPDGQPVGTGFTTLNGTWIEQDLGSGSDPNLWYYGSDEFDTSPCSESCNNNPNRNRSVFIAYPTAYGFFNTGAAYNAGGPFSDVASNRRLISPTVDLTGRSNLTLYFEYIENGDGTNDNAIVEYFDGTAWQLLDDPPKTTQCVSNPPNHAWVSRTVNLPAVANNNSAFQFAFRWVNNNDGIGQDPSVAIDNIRITTPLGLRQEFILGAKDATLLATLTRFEGYRIGDYNWLQWEIDSPQEVRYFELLRGESPKTLVPIIQIPAAPEQKSYYYKDRAEVATYYQLRVVKWDGTILYSSVVYIKNSEPTILFYPNPAKDYLQIAYYLPTEKTLLVRIWNIVGGKVWENLYSLSSNGGILQVPLQHLNAGTYYLEILTSSGNKVLLRPFVKL